jgi:hypothetical protein
MALVAGDTIDLGIAEISCAGSPVQVPGISSARLKPRHEGSDYSESQGAGPSRR